MLLFSYSKTSSFHFLEKISENVDSIDMAEIHILKWVKEKQLTILHLSFSMGINH